MNESILIGETGLDLTKLLTDGFYYVYMKTSKKSNQEILKINAHHIGNKTKYTGSYQAITTSI